MLGAGSAAGGTLTRNLAGGRYFTAAPAQQCTAIRSGGIGGDWGTGGGRAAARLHRRPLSRAHAGAARAGAELSRGAGTLLPAVRSGHWCLSSPPRQPGSGGAAAVECLTHPRPTPEPPSLDRGHGPAGHLRWQWACLPAEAAAQASGRRAQRARPLSRASNSVCDVDCSKRLDVHDSDTAPTTTQADPEVGVYRSRILLHRVPTVRASVRHPFFVPTHPPFVYLLQQQRRSSAALFAAAAFGGDWGTGGG